MAMKSLIGLFAVILICGAAQIISASGDIVCKDGIIYISNPVDCSSFYQCTNGVPILHECPLGFDGLLVFDPNLNVCVYPDSYDCQIFACHRYKNPTSCHSSPNNCSFCCHDLDDSIPRCGTYDDLIEAGCAVFERSQYNDNGYETSTDCIVIAPGEKRNITVTFSLKKHPLDFYFLMDTTGSMADDKNNVVALSESFVETLLNLTDDINIGFGTFKDKPMFADLDDYSFRNDLPLTSTTERFVERIKAAKVSGGGGDGPEACGDALAQVVECSAQIGWRNNTRRVVLVATDNKFHLAGVGAQFNINDPYVDGCYLDSQGYYTELLTMDFPSLEQIGSAYSKTPVTTVIFAASAYLSFFRDVASYFKSASVGLLSTDSSNIVELIRDEFARIDSKMQIEKSAATDAINFKYYSNCMGSDGERETVICENLPSSGEVTFTVEIDLPECPVDDQVDGTFIDFSPVGLPVSIGVNLSFLCD